MSRSRQFAVPAAIVAGAKRRSGEASDGGPGEAGQPRDAVTVVLIRDAEPGPGVEVYLMRRAATMAAFSGMTVFPGGRVDAADRAPLPDESGDESDGESAGAGWVGPPPDAWCTSLSADVSLATGLIRAAVRETFEECGVLLAGYRVSEQRLVGGDGSASEVAGEVVGDVSGPEWVAARHDLEARRLSLTELLRRENLVVRADLLCPWAHWLTPVPERRRYDTRFLLAALPPGQRTGAVASEAVEASWVRPSVALEELAAGDRTMVPPTAMTLADLAEHDSVAAAFADAAGRVVTRVLPRLVPDSGGIVRFRVPTDPEYDDPALGDPAMGEVAREAAREAEDGALADEVPVDKAAGDDSTGNQWEARR